MAKGFRFAFAFKTRENCLLYVARAVSFMCKLAFAFQSKGNLGREVEEKQQPE
jgi:hypothetical protein